MNQRRTREQIEAQLRADAPVWRDAVAQGAARGYRAPRPAMAWRWAAAAGVVLAAGVAIALLGSDPAPSTRTVASGDAPVAEATAEALQSPLVFPRLQLPALPEAQLVAVPSAGDLLSDALLSLDDPYSTETQRLTADAKRAIDFLRSALPAALVNSRS